MKPKVSVILPNRNHLRFLPARLASIEGQTLRDWELIAVDGESTDGSREWLGEAARRLPRMSLIDEPPTGPYGAWNRGIAAARGEYVYIATSDDDMEPECLERLAAALDRHSECGLAQGRLRVTDEGGIPLPPSDPLAWEQQPVPKFYLGPLLDRPHVRPAPHDGLLHAATGTVYTSITQLLIRRSVFDHVGLFRTDLGPGADFEWGARASFLHSVVYVPDAVATWRRHAAQATDDTKSTLPETRRAMAAMYLDALAAARRASGGESLNRLDAQRLSRPLRHQAWLFERQAAPGLATVLTQWKREPDLIPLDLRNRLLWKGKYHRCHLAFIHKEIQKLGTIRQSQEG